MSIFNLTRLAAIALAFISTSALGESKGRMEKLLWNSVPLAITVPIESETVMRLPTASKSVFRPALPVSSALKA